MRLLVFVFIFVGAEFNFLTSSGQTLSSVNQDSIRVVHYRQTADSLFQENAIDSAEQYVMKALAICESKPPKQWKTGEMVRLANRLVRAGKLTLSEQYVQKAIDLSMQIDSLAMADVYERSGGYYSDRGMYTTAYELLEKAATLYDQLDLEASYADCLTRIGIVLENQALYDRSLSYYFKADTVYESIQDTVGKGYLLNNIAVSFAKQKKYARAIEFYQKAVELYRSMGDSLYMVNTYANLGITYKNTGEYDKASIHLGNALEYYTKHKEPYSLASIFHNYGELYAVQKIYGRAIEYYTKSQIYATEVDAGVIIAYNHEALSRAYLAIGNTEKSLYHGRKGLALAEKLNILDVQRDTQQLIAESYQKTGDYRRALEAHLRYTAIKDSLQRDEQTRYVDQLHTQFEVIQKDAEINNLREQTAIQEERNTVQQNLNNFLIIGAGILLILLALLALMYVRSKRLNIVLQEQKLLLQEQHEEIKTAQDELVLKNEQLTQLNEEKDDIIAIVAHDLRSPLNQIHGLLSLVNKETVSGEQAQYLGLVNEVADTMKQRINRMLDVAAMNARQLNLQLQKIPASEIIKPVARTFAEQARQKGIELIVELNGHESLINADRNYLLQVYENLVSNALKFSPPERKVWLALEERQGIVALKVRDEGPGISAEDQELLFSKYQALTAKPTKGEDSTGLGLAIVKKYVEAMGGAVWCESTVGKGAEFIIQFARA